MDNIPETRQTDLEEMPPPAKKSRRWLWAILGAVLVLVLAAASFLGGRYLQNSPKQATRHAGLEINGLPVIPSPELPTAAADVIGVFVRRQNNSIFVGTGHVQMSIQWNASGTPQGGSSYDGPAVEVVVTNNTKIYYDDTVQSVRNLPSSATQIQQKVVPGTLDQINQNSLINAWGRKTGDRLIADVLLWDNRINNKLSALGGR